MNLDPDSACITIANSASTDDSRRVLGPGGRPLELAERDWQVSDELLIVAREQFCANALSQVRAEVEDATKAQHTKYQRIGELIRLWDEKAAGLFKETGRSTVPRLKQIAVLYSMKLLDDELSRFSPEAMGAVSAFKAASKA